MGLLPLFVAEEKGYFEEQQIDVHWQDVGDPSQAANLFHADRADLIITTFAGLLPAEVREPGHFRLLCPVNEPSSQPGSYVLVKPDSQLRSIQDLRGRTLGTYSGPTQKAYAIIVLKRLGLEEPRDVQLVQVGSAAQIAGLFGGAFDALFTVEPYASTAIAQGARILEEGVRPKWIADPFWVGSVAIRTRMLKEHPGIENKILHALDQAATFILQNEDEARRILERRTGISTDVANRCGLYKWIAHPTRADMAEIQEQVDFLVAEGLLAESVHVKDLFDGIPDKQ